MLSILVSFLLSASGPSDGGVSRDLHVAMCASGGRHPVARWMGSRINGSFVTSQHVGLGSGPTWEELAERLQTQSWRVPPDDSAHPLKPFDTPKLVTHRKRPVGVEIGLCTRVGQLVTTANLTNWKFPQVELIGPNGGARARPGLKFVGMGTFQSDGQFEHILIDLVPKQGRRRLWIARTSGAPTDGGPAPLNVVWGDPGRGGRLSVVDVAWYGADDSNVIMAATGRERGTLVGRVVVWNRQDGQVHDVDKELGRTPKERKVVLLRPLKRDRFDGCGCGYDGFFAEAELGMWMNVRGKDVLARPAPTLFTDGRPDSQDKDKVSMKRYQAGDVTVRWISFVDRWCEGDIECEEWREYLYVTATDGKDTQELDFTAECGC